MYVILHHAIRNFQKPERYSLGISMDKILLECLESCFCATAAPASHKHLYVTKASAQFDTLKLYIRISLRVHCLPEPVYVKLIPRLGECGRMLGGWMTKIQNTKS
jgi:hypothetical protein